jgi:hypothetical protein
MRELPEHELDPAELEARRIFESYTSGAQSAKFNMAAGAISGVLAGYKAGPPGIFLGALIGTLGGFWRSKAYRERAYIELERLGVIKARRYRYRSVWDMHNAEYVFVRLPYAELTAWKIVPLIEAAYPQMAKSEIADVGRASQRTLIEFRKANPDIPISMGADLVLAYYGVMRDADGEYSLQTLPGHVYIPPSAYHIPIIPPTTTEPNGHNGASEKEEPNYMLYALAFIAVLFIMRQ